MKFLRLLGFALSLWSWFACKSPRPIQPERPLRAAEPPAVKSTGNVQLDYVQRYKDVAVSEMQRTGIPASIKLAQGILESGSGRSELAVRANNHFGIKCGNNWTGKTYHKKDDDRDADGNSVESCFRRYEKPEESFFDHSEFIRDPRKAARYGFLFNLDPTDYRAWARGLQTAGYATSPEYADRLISLIENLRLYEYDRPGTVPPAPGTIVPERIPPQERIQYVNDVKMVRSLVGETIADIARIYQLNPLEVADYNDRAYAPGDRLPAGTRIFIQPKRRSWRGRTTHHFVREGQTMLDIAQQYGIQLEALLERNGMRYGQEPLANEKIRLRGKRRSDEVVRLRGQQTTPSPKPTPPPSLIPDDKPVFERPDTSTSPPIAPQPLPDRPALTGVPYPKDPVPEPAPSPTLPVVVVPPPANTGPPPPTPPSPTPVFHRVERGDTLFSLSRRYGISVAELKKINQLSSDQIQVGQVLRVQ